jgi:anti-anti-sigma factor
MEKRMLDIKEELHGGTAVATLSGKLNADTAKSFEKWSSTRDNGSVQRIIIDCSGLTYISSAGLRAILTTNRHAEQSGTTLLFCGLDGIVRDVFQTAGLLSHLRVYPGIAAALAAE